MKDRLIEDSPLRALFWKEEILQVLYWMDGEGFGKMVPVSQVLAFLSSNEENLLYHLNKLHTAGLLDIDGNSVDSTSYIGLAPVAKKEAGRHFAESFQGLQKAGHGECGPDCEFCYGPDGKKLENCVHDCASQN